MAKLTPSTYDQPPGHGPGTASGHRPAAGLEPRPELDRLEQYRPALTGYCARMLRSSADADDAAQETLVRAWRRLDSFEGRGSVRSWLYRIATNVCYDLLDSRHRRALPIDVTPELRGGSSTRPGMSGAAWAQARSGRPTQATEDDPADVAVAQESVELAFGTALQHLPPRQRAVLILREVLGWRASEVAELLDTSLAAVNSALQRARATMAARDATATTRGVTAPEVQGAERAWLSSYVTAFEALDVDSLVSLLHADATESQVTGGA